MDKTDAIPKDSVQLLLSDITARDMHPGTVWPEMGEWITKTFGEDAKRIIGMIRESGKIYIPAVGMMESFIKAGGPENAGSIDMSALKFGTHLVMIEAPNGQQIKQAAGYTDFKLLTNREIILEKCAREWFIDILTLNDSEGVAINPKTRFMKADLSEYYITTNRFGVAELIGMLEIGELPVGAPYYQLANEAFERGEYFKVLYYWSNSFKNARPGDDWKQCEISKLRSYYALNFPGSRAKLVSELQWMLDNQPGADIVAYAKTLQRE